MSVGGISMAIEKTRISGRGESIRTVECPFCGESLKQYSGLGNHIRRDGCPELEDGDDE